jgi:excisionase family DNA binding protein
VRKNNTRAPRRELISLADAAREVGIHPKTIARMIASGDIPGYKVGRRGLLKIDARDLDLLARRVRPGEVSA